MKYQVKSSWPGRETLAPTDLRDLWRDLEAQKLVRVVFYDGRISAFRDFADWAYEPGNHFAVIYGPQPDVQPWAFFG